MEIQELSNVDYGPIFDRVSFEGFRNYLMNSNLTTEDSVKDGCREFYFFEEGVGHAIVNLKTRTVNFRLVDESILARLSFKLSEDVQRSVKLKQSARITNG